MKCSQYLLFSLLFSACGHRAILKSPHTDGSKKKVLQQEVDIQTIRKMAKKKLETMVSYTESLGPEAKEFLATNLFLKATHASLAKDYESSTLVYESILKLDPQDPYLVLKYAVDLIRLGKATQALSLLEKHYSQSGPYWEKFSLLLGGVYGSYKKEKKAIKIYSAILKKNPKHVEACVLLGKLYFQNKKAEKALKTIEKCEKENPGQGETSYYLGKIYLSSGNIRMAKESFQKSLAIQPTFYQSTLAMGLILEDEGNMAGAINVYKKLLQHWPNNRVILARLVQSLFIIEKNNEVIEYAQKLVLLDPSDLNLRVKLGILYAYRRDYPKAIKIFEEVIKEVPESNKVLYYLAAIYQELKEYEKAIGLFFRIPQEDPLYFTSSLQIAKVLTTLAVKDQENESRLFDFIAQRSLINGPLELELQILKGQYYELNNKIKKSIEVIERVVSRPGFTNSQKYYLATLQDRVKNYDRSLGLMREILKSDPKNAHAWNFMGYSYLEQEKEVDKAYEYIRKAVALRPRDGYIRDSLGWYFYKTGKLESALKELKLAHKLVGNDSTIAKHLALVYEALSQYDLANVFYFKALSLVKEVNERNEVLQFINRLKDSLARDRHPASLP